MPVRVLELDVAQGLQVAVPPSRYDRVRLLVRDGATPLGYLDRTNSPAALDADAIAEAVAGTPVSFALWAHRTGRRWEPAPEDRAPRARPPITVVVCTRDRAGELEGCLSALAAQDYPSYTVLVVDNGSRDGATRDLVARFGMQYVLEPRPGLNVARDAGWRAARDDLIAYTDDDARPATGWLTAIAAGFAVPDVEAVTGLVAPAELETRAQLLCEDAYGGMGRGFRLRIHSCRGRDLTYWPHKLGVGCNMAFRRSTLERLGGFDPALDVGTPTGGGGDLDILQRVLEADGAVCYRPEALVWHVHRRTERALRRQLFNNGRGYVAFALAALRRAPAGERRAVLVAIAVWFSWLLRRAGRGVRRRDALPLGLSLAELAGAILGAWYYWTSCRRARRLAGAGR